MFLSLWRHASIRIASELKRVFVPFDIWRYPSTRVASETKPLFCHVVPLTIPPNQDSIWVKGTVPGGATDGLCKRGHLRQCCSSGTSSTIVLIVTNARFVLYQPWSPGRAWKILHYIMSTQAAIHLHVEFLHRALAFYLRLSLGPTAVPGIVFGNERGVFIVTGL